MPKEGFDVITVSQALRDQLVADMKEANRLAGYKKFRSLPHYVETCAVYYRKASKTPPEANTQKKVRRKSDKK